MELRDYALEDCEIKSEMIVIHGMIVYKGIPLWRTINDNISNYDFFVYDPNKTPYKEDDPDYYSLLAIDNFGDSYSYGYWKSESEVREWLKNPKKVSK
jgi:hypothetical protein